MTPAACPIRNRDGITTCRKILAALRGPRDEFPGVTARQDANDALARVQAVR